MKSFVYILLVCMAISYVEAQSVKNKFPNLNHSSIKHSVAGGNVTYVHFGKSVSGPFTSPATLLPTDSFYVKMDVTPYGTATSEYYLDVNKNSVIDLTDLPLGGDTYVDNNTTPPGIIDLDPAPGVIIAALKPDRMPSMQIVARITDGLTSAEGILIFQNPPRMYTLSGIVHNTAGGVVGGAMIWVGDSTGNTGVGDASDQSGHYSVPIDAGTYFIHVGDFSMARYSSFDTMMVISANKAQDFYLSPLNSYIRGYVKDENSNPLPNVGIYFQNNNGGTMTDLNGMYKLMIAPGSGYIGVSSESVLPNYLCPNQHQYTIADNDSIVNDSVSNFTCYTVNASITGSVKENGLTPVHTYMVGGGTEQFNSSTFAATDASGHYVLPVRDAMTMPLYNLNISNWDDRYPIPPGMYPDTSYWGISPGSVANFNIIGAETLFVEPFTGEGVSPSWASWNTYYYNSPWGPSSAVTCSGDRLMVECNSNGGLSGIGVVSRKPFSLHNREYRILADPSQMDASNNTIKIILSDQNMNWEYPQNFKNSLQLIWEKSPIGLHQWRLVKTKNSVVTDLCISSDSMGHYILFQFIDPDTLKFKIGSTVYYNGPLGNLFSMVYLYLTEFNLDPDEPAPVYFDELFIGALGTTGVREVGGDLPSEFKLDQNYPNPFNPSTVIRYHIPVGSQVMLKVFNTLGQEVSTLVNSVQSPGNYEVTLLANYLTSGVYYYRLSTVDLVSGKQTINTLRKALLLK
jgi:hypothetical protein